MSVSTSKISGLNSFKIYVQAEAMPTALNNEDASRKTRSVTIEKPSSQRLTLNETRFSPSVLTIKTWTPKLPMEQKISLIFSYSIHLSQLN